MPTQPKFHFKNYYYTCISISHFTSPRQFETHEHIGRSQSRTHTRIHGPKVAESTKILHTIYTKRELRVATLMSLNLLYFGNFVIATMILLFCVLCERLDADIHTQSHAHTHTHSSHQIYANRMVSLYVKKKCVLRERRRAFGRSV